MKMTIEEFDSEPIVLRRLSNIEKLEPEPPIDILPTEVNWIPCRTLNQHFIPELSRAGYRQVLVTYLTGKMKKPMVTTAWVEHGRLLNKKFQCITAFCLMPSPYLGGEADEPLKTFNYRTGLQRGAIHRPNDQLARTSKH